MSVHVQCPFLKWIVSLVLSFVSSLYILDTNPISDVICKHLLPFRRLLFSFVDCFLCCSEAFYFDEVPVVYLRSVSLAPGDISRKKLLQLMSKKLLSMLSSGIFMVSRFTRRSLTHFEFIFA